MTGNKPGSGKPWYTQALSYVMWLASAGLGLYALYSLYKLSLTVYALIGKEYYVGVLVGQVTTVIAAIGWIILIVIGGEALRKHAGESKIYRLLGGMIGVEMVLILMGVLFG